MKLTVDRIEGELAVLLMQEDEQIQVHLPLKVLPPVKEGDILEVTITKDAPRTEETRERVSNLIEKLKKKK